MLIIGNWWRCCHLPMIIDVLQELSTLMLTLRCQRWCYCVDVDRCPSSLAEGFRFWCWSVDHCLSRSFTVGQRVSMLTLIYDPSKVCKVRIGFSRWFLVLALVLKGCPRGCGVDLDVGVLTSKSGCWPCCWGVDLEVKVMSSMLRCWSCCWGVDFIVDGLTSKLRCWSRCWSVDLDV